MFSQSDSALRNSTFGYSQPPATISSLQQNAKDLKEPSLHQDSLSPDQTDKLNLRIGNDSLIKKGNTLKHLRQVFPHGTISIGEDYGFLPYTVNMPAPSSAFRTEGSLGLSAFNIPLEVTWFYSSQKNLIGLNNYFRISYDADAYKDKLNTSLLSDINSYKSQIGDLTAQRQQLMQKMAYTDYLANTTPDKWPSQGLSKTDSAGINTSAIPIDSSAIGHQLQSTSSFPVPDSSVTSAKADSSIYGYKLNQHKSDSVRALYDQYKTQYDQVNDSINHIKGRVHAMEGIMNGGYNAYLQSSPYFSKAQNFLSGIKKLEVGLCYPNYSTFLVNNVPVRGLNFEYSKNDRFLAFTYGTTVSTLLYSNRNVEGFLQGVRNSYNYFDFNNLAAGRKILAAKFGVGPKDGNHAHVGFLIGRGQTSYLQLAPEDPEVKTRESNLVLEADVKYKFSKFLGLDLILGKSSISNQDLSYETIRGAMQEVFSDFRSYALLTRINSSIPRTNSNLSFTFRWVDPFFKSYGIGFIRSDNMRYELKLDQSLGRKLRYTGMFRYEEDNLLKLINYQNTFYSINNTLSYKVKRGLMLRISYTPLFRTLRSDNYTISNRNSISTAVLTFSPRTKKTVIQFNALYNYYLVTADTQQINFKNFAYAHQIVFKNGLKTSLNLSWFNNNLRDSSSNNAYLGVLDLGYQFKNGSTCSIAGKAAYKEGQLYPGFILRTSLKIHKSIYWENNVEKFIVGDLFNGYDLENLKKFPYYCNTRLIFNF